LLTYLIRFLLIWWLFSVIYRWLVKEKNRGRGTDRGAGKRAGRDTVSGIPYHGDIEDADFEDLEDG